MPTTISSSQTVLARCVHSQSNFTRFEPLLSCVAGRWEEVRDPNLTFPEVGTVVSFDPMTMNAEVGSFWMFETEPSTRYAPGRGHDKFLARDPRPAMQVIDYSKLTLEKARYELVEVGIPISRVLTAEAIFCLGDDLCVRSALMSDALTGRQKADVHGLQDVALMRRHPQMAAGATAAGAMFVLPGREPHEIVDYVDWSPDDEFLERTLKRVRRMDGRGTNIVSLSRNAIETLSLYLRREARPSGDRDPLRRMRRRLADFLPNFEATVDDLDAIVGSLEAYRPVAERISRDVEARRIELDTEMRCELEPVVRRELEAHNSATVAELQRVLQDVAAAEAKRSELQHQVGMLTRSATDLKAALASDLAIVHDALEAAPTDASDDVSAIVRRVSAAIGDTPVGIALTPAATPPWGLGSMSQSARIGVDQLRERLGTEAGGWGVEGADLLIFDALLRAGELVVLVDHRDGFILEAYARSVSGGRLRKLVVDPSMIGLDDLWRQAGSGAPTPFAKAWTAARAHPDRTVVLAVECLNVAPMQFWLPMLSTELHGPDRPRNLLVAGTLAATGDNHRENLAVLRTVTVPLATAPSPGAWMRSALRFAGREPQESATVLEWPEIVPLSVDDTTRLLAGLTGISTLRPNEAGRAVKVMRSASLTMDQADALKLAMDVARVASGESELATIMKTPSVARGVIELDTLLQRSET
jgi:hypothetical protein